MRNYKWERQLRRENYTPCNCLYITYWINNCLFKNWFHPVRPANSFFWNPTAMKQKRSFPPLIAEAQLASSSFKNYFQTRRFSSPIQTLNTGTFTPKTLTKRRDSHPNLTIFSKPMTTVPFAWFPLREPSWLSLSEVVLDCTNLSYNSYQYCENHT